MIEFRHVYYTYPSGTHALRDIQVKIEKGEFVFLTGRSGAGKSTLFRLLTAFDVPSNGTTQIAGYSTRQLNSPYKLALFRRRIGIIFQDFRLLKNHTVFENMALPLFLRGDRPHLIEKRVHEIADQVGLFEKLNDLPEFLSGGEQQRTAIARALVHQPAVLVADEPTGNLDPDLSEEIISLLERVCEQGTTVVVATHDHKMVEQRKSRRLHLENGELVFDSRNQNLIRRQIKGDFAI